MKEEFYMKFSHFSDQEILGNSLIQEYLEI